MTTAMLRLLRCCCLTLPTLYLSCATDRTQGNAPITFRRPCRKTRYWDGLRCQKRGDATRLINDAEHALKQFDIDRSLSLLSAAKTMGPFALSDYEKLYEQLGIAYAYMGQRPAALQAFSMLLTLNPRHLISYRLSPKATFLFERARLKAGQAPSPTIYLSWPHDLTVADRIPIDIEVGADPQAFLFRAALFVRSNRAKTYRAVDVSLPKTGRHRRLMLPPLRGNKADILELYLRAYDRQGNEVLLLGSERSPRRIPLSYQAPLPWYRKWWIWAIFGGVVAAGTGATIAVLTKGTPSTVGGSFSLAR